MKRLETKLTLPNAVNGRSGTKLYGDELTPGDVQLLRRAAMSGTGPNSQVEAVTQFGVMTLIVSPVGTTDNFEVITSGPPR